jgi:hypothetical protein
VKTSDLMERSLVTVSNAMEEGLCWKVYVT